MLSCSLRNWALIHLWWIINIHTLPHSPSAQKNIDDVLKRWSYRKSIFITSLSSFVVVVVGVVVAILVFQCKMLSHTQAWRSYCKSIWTRLHERRIQSDSSDLICQDCKTCNYWRWAGGLRANFTPCITHNTNHIVAELDAEKDFLSHGDDRYETRL